MLFLRLALICFSWSLWAQDCQFPYAKNAKTCPTGGTTLLDDTYPVSNYVISIAPNYPTKKAMEVPGQFVLKVLAGHNFSESAPNIIVPADPEAFRLLKKSLEEKIASSKGNIPASILNKLIPAEGESYTWQQDYFESFFNPETGKPVVRKIESYGRGGANAVDNLAKSAASCEVLKGPDLKTDHGMIVPGGKSFESGEMGGNIEGLPGGLCLVGDNLSPKFSKQFCGKEENIVQMDVSWLTVGHVDEVFKVVPGNLPGVPAECNFSLMFASPKKALELLSAPRAENHPLFSGEFLKASASQSELNDFRLSRSSKRAGHQLCSILEKFAQPRREKSGGKKLKNRAKEALYKSLHLMIDVAYAEELQNLGGCEVDSITTGEFLAAMNDPEFKDYNQLIQESLDESKKLITKKILGRLPQCEKHLSVIDVPNLFYGTAAVDAAGKKSLPKPGDGGSFLPNPTNSVVANKSVIFSDPQNPIFRDYLTKTLKERQLGAAFIDTWDYSHLGDGNLHCSSHSIPYCVPAKKGSK